VGILIHKNILEGQFTIHTERFDENGNFLLLDLTMGNSRYTIGTIYGPNHDDQTNFYDELKIVCEELRNRKIILGGDFNATWDNGRINSNIDVVNMVALPSIARTEKIREISEQLNLVEPYRLLNPNKKDYTYIPSALNNMNRSRLDFFLVSNELMSVIVRYRMHFLAHYSITNKFSYR
jgi:exonuclease III